jgi:hypothetical protein
MTYQGLPGFFRGGARSVSEAFDVWLRETGSAALVERDRRFAEST